MFSFYARRTSEWTHRRYLYSQLGPGTLTAHKSFCLVLLHSCPDTVHRFLLRETQTSAPLIKGSSAKYKPQIGITPAVADCRYRAPLTPRLRGNVMTYPHHMAHVLPYYNLNRSICQMLLRTFSSPKNVKSFCKVFLNFFIDLFPYINKGGF